VEEIDTLLELSSRLGGDLPRLWGLCSSLKVVMLAMTVFMWDMITQVSW